MPFEETAELRAARLALHSLAADAVHMKTRAEMVSVTNRMAALLTHALTVAHEIPNSAPVIAQALIMSQKMLSDIEARRGKATLNDVGKMVATYLGEFDRLLQPLQV